MYVSDPGGANRVLPLPYRAPVDSTNTACARHLRESPLDDWCLLWTDEQTAGRGRSGRTWDSRPGDSLCLSVARRFPPGAFPHPSLSVAIGAALVLSLRRLGCEAAVKWPNDILLNGRKLGGVLCEAISSSGDGATLLVAGVGINLRPFERLPAQSIPSAAPAPLAMASLSESGLDMQAADLAGLLAQAMADVLSTAETPANLSAWCSQAAGLDAWRGQAISVLDRGQVLDAGTALGIEPDGQYRIATAAGDRVLAVGELSLRGGT